MTLSEFIDRLIVDGVTAAHADYGADTEKERGAVAGFEDCRNQDQAGLGYLLQRARHQQRTAFLSNAPDYWYWVCYAAEIEWVCNCVSAGFAGTLAPLVPTTARGVLKATQVLAP